MTLPPPPTGIGPQAAWLFRLWLYLKSIRHLRGTGYILKETSEGTIMQIAPRGGGGKGSTKVQTAKFQSWGFAAEPTNMDVITADGLKVYLPPLLRYSVTARTVYTSTTIAYDQYKPTPPYANFPIKDPQSRNATIGQSVVTQFITPQYEIGDEIYIMQIGGLWRDLNADGRVFAGP